MKIMMIYFYNDTESDEQGSIFIILAGFQKGYKNPRVLTLKMMIKKEEE